MKVRDRIVELKRIRAGDIAPNPRNWRTHPREQRGRVGFGMEISPGYVAVALERLSGIGIECKAVSDV